MATRWRSMWMLLLLAFVAPAAWGRDAAPSLQAAQAAAIDAAVIEEMHRQDAVGVAIGLIEHGQVVYVKGYGFADREAHEAVTTATRFRWASVSKTITAIAALQLAEQHRLDLDADVRHYVPEFPDKGVRITARELLDHQSGIVHYDNGKVVKTVVDYPQAHPFVDPVKALDFFKASPLIARPGEKFSYSSYAYILLSAVVQRAGGAPYIAQVRKRVLAPFGLEDIRPDYQWEQIAHRAVGYEKQHDTIRRSGDSDVSWKLGAGGFLSTIGEFAGYAAALLSHRLVSAQTEQAMWTPQPTASGQPTNWGLGFEVDDNNGRLRVAHNGAQEKTRTRLVIYPQEGRGAVVMTNSEWVDPGRFTTAVFGALAATH